MITFANSLEPDQADRMSAKLFDTLMVFLKEFFKKFALEKNQQPTKKHEQFPRGKEVNHSLFLIVYGLQGWHRLEFSLEKSLKIKSALKSTEKSLKNLVKSLNYYFL